MYVDVTLIDGSSAVVKLKEAADIIATDEEIIYSLFNAPILKLEDRGAWVTVDKIYFAKVRRD